MTLTGYLVTGVLTVFSFWFVVFVLFVANLLRQKTALKLLRSSLFILIGAVTLIAIFRGLV